MGSARQLIGKVENLSVGNEEFFVAEKRFGLHKVHVDIEGSVGALHEREFDFFEARALIGGCWVHFSELSGKDWKEGSGLGVTSSCACVMWLDIALLGFHGLSGALDVIGLCFVISLEFSRGPFSEDLCNIDG